MTTPKTIADGLSDDLRIVAHEECLMTGDLTLRLSDGSCIRFNRAELLMMPAIVEEQFAQMKLLGADSAAKRIDVIHFGKKVGELPVAWVPALAKSRSNLYDYRPRDLKLIDGRWHACDSLWPADLDCLIGFRRTEVEANTPPD